MAKARLKIFLRIVSGLLMLSTNSLLFAQEDPSPFNSMNRKFSASVRDAYEKSVRELIERHISPESYQLLITVEATAPEAKSVPYLPETLAPINAFQLPIELLSDYVTKLDMEILLADRFKKATRDKLQEIIEKTLHLSKERGHTISFSTLGIEIAVPQTELERSLSKLEADNRSIQEQIAVLARERDDAKAEWIVMKNERDVAKETAEKIKNVPRDGDSAKVENTEKSAETDQNLAPGNSPEAEGFFSKNFGMIIVTLLLLVAMFFGTTMIRGLFTTFGNSIRSIGDALPILGEKIAAAIPSGQATLLPSPVTQKSNALQEDMRVPSNLPVVPLGPLFERLLVLQQEILASYNERTEFVILKQVAQLLSKQETVAKGVVTLEILNKDKANLLFHRLARKHQQTIWNFLENGSYPRHKSEVMLEAGEELKTKLIGASIDRTFNKVNDTVAEKILLLQDEDLVVLFKEARIELIPRIMHYLEPGRIGAALEELAKTDDVRLGKIGQVMPQVAEAANAEDLDQDLLSLVEEYANRAGSNSQALYLDFYKSILESVKDDVAETVMASMRAVEPKVENYLSNSIITFNTLWRLLVEIQEQIAGDLSNREIAALIAGSSDSGIRERLLALIENSRAELIEDEVKTLQGRGQRQLMLAFNQAKQRVISGILAIKGNDPISELMEKDQAAANQSSDWAA